MKDPRMVEIIFQGCLGTHFAGWFEPLQMTFSPDTKTTILTGMLPDQPALYGLLLKIQNLGLTLLSVRQIEDIDNS